MEMLLYIIIGVACGFAVAWFWRHAELTKALQQQVMAEKMLAEQQQHFQEKLEAERLRSEERIEAEQRRSAERIAAEQQHARELREAMEEQHAAKNKLVQEEIRNMAAQMLNDSRKELNAADKERLDGLLTPLKERIDAFQKTVQDNSKEGAQNKTEIKSAFEAAMKVLREEQERTVRELKEQTQRIGDDAASLTRALKGDSKLQGDWGEMILERTLEDCGLVKDEQFFLQENYKDAEGNNFRPDAVVVFPNDERAVIDAKVSLTAYQEAVRAAEMEEQERLLKEHVASVKHHIDELSRKDYEKLVPGTIGYVLMFIPYESGYSAALKTDSSLLQYAYRKHVILLSPSNLLMALQLTRTMWQNYRMNKNVEEILRQSNDLYDKFVTFSETFLKMGADIQRLHDDFDKAKNQLRDGKGNIVRRLDGMKSLGITPKKQIPEELSSSSGNMDSSSVVSSL